MEKADIIKLDEIRNMIEIMGQTTAQQSNSVLEDIDKIH